MQAALKSAKKASAFILYESAEHSFAIGYLRILRSLLGAGSDEHRDLYLEKTEQPRVLAVAGFSLVTLLLDREGMALYACRP